MLEVRVSKEKFQQALQYARQKILAGCTFESVAEETVKAFSLGAVDTFLLVKEISE